MTPDELYENALRLARERYPQAHPNLHSTFAKSVVYLVTERVYRSSGLTVRELAVCWYFTGRRLSYDEAVEILLRPKGFIFGPLYEIHHQVKETTLCVCDTPEDVAVLGVEAPDVRFL